MAPLWGLDESEVGSGTHAAPGDKPRYMAIDAQGNQLANTMGANTSSVEAGAAGVTSAGWQHLINYTNTKGVERKRFETLVATKNLTSVPPSGDDIEDI